MQPSQILHLIIFFSLATKLLGASKIYKYIPRCPSMCGDVWIGPPFGIGRNCSANEWFTINCTSSTPYLPALDNVEVLSVHKIHKGSVVVNMSAIKADCKNPIHNKNRVQSIGHGKNPFLFSGSHNIFVVEGCGSAAIMENGTVVSGCVATCGNDTANDINNCFGNGCCQTTVPRDLESFTFDLTGLGRQKNGDRICGPAFLVYKDYAKKIFSPSLVNDDTFIPISLTWSCEYMCGEVLIPYPFGIGRDCAWTEWFVVDCNSSRAYLPALDHLEVLVFDSSEQTITVNVSKTSDCQNSSQLLLSKTPYSFSRLYNILVIEGCGNAIIMEEDGTIINGCSTTCGNETISDINNCFGIGCCQTTIPHDLRSLTFNLTALKGHANGSCGSAFLMSADSYMERRFDRQSVPIKLIWTTDINFDDQEDCRVCEGHGGHCYYPDHSSTMFCRFYGSNKKSLGVILGVSISMGLLFLTVVTYALYELIKKNKVKRRKRICFERNGGLILKQQETADIALVDYKTIGLVDYKTIIFTIEELEKATDNFNENRILGKGAQGTVYKGMLADGGVVAIKKSENVSEIQVEQFINEVLILAQVNHRNVVRLLGCCLETEVPLLVFEFIPNGTLHDNIHNKTGESSLSFNLSLQIATEVAGAVSYLHSAISSPIYHRDIKSSNILLDEKYRAKVADSGISRFVPEDNTHLITSIKGTCGYFDPEYFQTRQFNEKSDVYSFGVVLLELLIREKPISLEKFGTDENLVTYFKLAMKENRVMSIFDAKVVEEGSTTALSTLANLALRCLEYSRKDRPTMKNVFMELESIRLSYVSCSN